MLNPPPVESEGWPPEVAAANGDGSRPALPAPPPLGEQLAATFRGARPAWSPSSLAPLWIASMLTWLLWESDGIRSIVPRSGAVLITILLAWPPAVLVMALSAWEFGRGEKLDLRAGIGLLASRLGSAVGGPLLVVGGASVLVAAIVGGALALAQLPVVGKALAACWCILPGVPLGLLAAGLLLLGVPALPLILAAGSVEEPFAFEVAARGMSYLRAGPTRWLALLASALAGALAGAAVFAAFAGLLAIIGILAGAPGLGASDLSFPGRLEDLGGELRSLLSEFTWPFAGLLGLEPPRTGQPVAVVIGRSVTAFLAAAALSGLARAYLFIRWQVDGEPPGSQVRPGEEFDWSKD
jgi:hypothetical protein